MVRGLAARAGWRVIRIHSPRAAAAGTLEATWMLVASEPQALDHPAIRAAAAPASSSPPLLWTDDSASLWRVLKF